jgi:hypothetical protein
MTPQRHTEEFHITLHRQLLSLHRTLAAEKVLVGLDGSYTVLLAAVRECLDDLNEVIHPRDVRGDLTDEEWEHDHETLDKLLQEQEALAQAVTATVAWVNEEKRKK